MLQNLFQIYWPGLQHIRNGARLRGINMLSVNVSNFADGVPFIHNANIENN